MKKSILRQYAKLIVRCGVNVQKGQEVLINCGLDQPEFVAMVARSASTAWPVSSTAPARSSSTVLPQAKEARAAACSYHSATALP